MIKGRNTFRIIWGQGEALPHKKAVVKLRPVIKTKKQKVRKCVQNIINATIVASAKNLRATKKREMLAGLFQKIIKNVGARVARRTIGAAEQIEE